MIKKLMLFLLFSFSLGCSKINNPNTSSSTSSSVNISSSSINTTTFSSSTTSNANSSPLPQSTMSSSLVKPEIKYKILLIAGHGNGDPGAAYQNRLESNYNQDFVNLLTKELNSFNIPIEILLEPTPMKAIQEAELISKSNVDFVLSVHFNAGGGKGSEMIVPFYEKDFSFAYNFFDKLEDNNFDVRETSVYSKSKNQRIKRNKNDRSYSYEDYFAVIRAGSKKKIPSYILEVEFIDNISQMKIYDQRKEAYISLLAQNIIEYFK